MKQPNYKRFHKRIFFEKEALDEINLTVAQIKTITPTRHFQNKMKSYHIDKLPSKQDLLYGDVFEYYREPKGKIEKFCVRCSKEQKDIIYVISKGGVIITSWTNMKNDSHKTLDRNLYEKGVG